MKLNGKSRMILIFAMASCVLSSCAVDDPPEAHNPPFPLHHAAVHYPERIADLISGGVDIDSVNESGLTALQMAVTFGKVDSVRQLLVAGANPNVGDDEFSPVSLAAMSGNIEIVRMLLIYRANPNAREQGRTALHNVAIFGHADIARLLVAFESTDVNIQEEGTGYTALHCAVQHEKLDVISVLLQAGVNADIKDSAGNTSLVLAKFKSNKEIAALLTESGR